MNLVINRQFSQLSVILETLARANGNLEVVKEIKEIKAACPIPFESLCVLYLRSFGMSPNRGVRIMALNKRFRPYELQELAGIHIVEPLTDITTSLIGQLSETTNVSIKNYVAELTQDKQAASENLDGENEDEEPKVILDL